MDFSPSVQMRLSAALRSFLQNRIIRDGFSEKNRHALETLYLYEGRSIPVLYTSAYDVAALTADMLIAASALLMKREIFLSADVKEGNVRLINLRLYEFFVFGALSCVPCGSNIHVDFSCLKNGVRMSFFGNIDRVHAAKKAARAGGFSLNLLGSGVFSLFFPCQETALLCRPSYKGNEQLSDPYSVLRVIVDRRE